MVNFCFVCPCNFASQAIPLGILQTMSSYVCLLWTDDVKNYRTWQEFDEVLCIETVPRHTVSPKTVVLQHHLHHRPSIISVLKWQIWTNFARTHLATKAVTSAPTTGVPPCISLYYISRWVIWCHIYMWYYMVPYFSVIWVNFVAPCITFASKTNCAPAVRSRSASPTLQDWKTFFQSKLIFFKTLSTYLQSKVSYPLEPCPRPEERGNSGGSLEMITFGFFFAWKLHPKSIPQ